MRFTITRLTAVASAVLASYAATYATVQTYPSKLVRILGGAPTRGSNYIFARAIGQRVSPALRQPVVVDNEPV